jgi:hypothetical protein
LVFRRKSIKRAFEVSQTPKQPTDKFYDELMAEIPAASIAAVPLIDIPSG